jgi:hypothetical protein
LLATAGEEAEGQEKREQRQKKVECNEDGREGEATQMIDG